MDRPHPNHIRQSVFFINNYGLVVSRLAVSIVKKSIVAIIEADLSQYTTHLNPN